jgi:hypothetical protein
LLALQNAGDPLHLSLAEQGGRARPAYLEVELLDDVDADRLGETRRLVEARLDVARIVVAAEIREGDDGSGAARKFGVGIAIENAQAADSSSSWSMKLTGRSGWTVETACL